jgi:hypothetical protein
MLFMLIDGDAMMPAKPKIEDEKETSQQDYWSFLTTASTCCRCRARQNPHQSHVGCAARSSCFALSARASKAINASVHGACNLYRSAPFACRCDFYLMASCELW